MFGGPGHETACNRIGVRVPVTGPVGEQMPNSNQHFASDSDDGFVFAQPDGESIKYVTPVGRVCDRQPGGLNQRRAQFAAAWFGDGASALGLSRVMHTRPQPTVAHQLFSRREAVNVANRTQDGHRTE